jgi:hypothetical protein
MSGFIGNNLLKANLQIFGYGNAIPILFSCWLSKPDRYNIPQTSNFEQFKTSKYYR